jgi:hypothetical protein
MENIQTPKRFSAEAERLRRQGINIVSENSETGEINIKSSTGSESSFKLDDVIAMRDKMASKKSPEKEISLGGMVVNKMTEEERRSSKENFGN